MSKIKEIRKIEPKIKEIKKEKAESLDDEVIEEFDQEEHFVSTNGLRRFNKTSTLDAAELPPTPDLRERRITKEDEQEVNFRPSYTGGGNNPYQGNKYTPVGTAESAATRDTRPTDPGFENRTGLQRPQEQMQQQQGGERAGERTYAGESEQDKRRERRKNL